MKRIGIILARICFIGMVLAGCSNEADGPTGDGVTASTAVYTGTYIHSVRHDGHLFVVYYDKAIIHHPSCPCGGRP